MAHHRPGPPYIGVDGHHGAPEVPMGVYMFCRECLRFHGLLTNAEGRHYYKCGDRVFFDDKFKTTK